MKKFSELTEQEVLALTEKEIQFYIDYDCATQGLGLLPLPVGPKPEPNIVEPDSVVYCFSDIKCLHAEDAQKIMAIINSSTVVNTDYDYPDSDRRRITKILKKDDYYYPKMVPQDVYSVALWDTVKDQAKEYGKALRRYNDDKAEYDKAVSERKSITDGVRETIQEMQDHAAKRERLRAEFARYLELSEGSVSIALNFLLKVNDLREFPDLMDEWTVLRLEEVTGPKI